MHGGSGTARGGEPDSEQMCGLRTVRGDKPDSELDVSIKDCTWRQAQFRPNVNQQSDALLKNISQKVLVKKKMVASALR